MSSEMEIGAPPEKKPEASLLDVAEATPREALGNVRVRQVQVAKTLRRRHLGRLLAGSALLAVLLLGVVLMAIPGPVARAGQPLVATPPSALRTAQPLYERLLAPCCWTQTLDVHDSDLASQLRHEIGARLADGDSALAIEDDLARRFGERVRAIPRGRDPRQGAAWFAIGVMGLSLFALVYYARRWTARARAGIDQLAAETSIPMTHAEDAHYERELELSLERLGQG